MITLNVTLLWNMFHLWLRKILWRNNHSNLFAAHYMTACMLLFSPLVYSAYIIVNSFKSFSYFSLLLSPKREKGSRRNNKGLAKRGVLNSFLLCHKPTWWPGPSPLRPDSQDTISSHAICRCPSQTQRSLTSEAFHPAKFTTFWSLALGYFLYCFYIFIPIGWL